MANPLLQLLEHGQSVWYDNISRGTIVSGQLQRLIDEDGVRGVTSNPAIFEKAISGSDDYRGALRSGTPEPDDQGPGNPGGDTGR